MMVFGHGGNTVTRMPEAAKGIEELELLVGRTRSNYMGGARRAQNNTYLATDMHQFRRERLSDSFEPLAAVDGASRAADLLSPRMTWKSCTYSRKSSASPTDVQEHQSRKRYRRRRTSCAKSPRRLVDRLYRPVAGALKLHMANQKDFDLVSLRAKTARPRATTTRLPWPCGVRRNSSIPAPTRFTTPIST